MSTYTHFLTKIIKLIYISKFYTESEENILSRILLKMEKGCRYIIQLHIDDTLVRNSPKFGDYVTTIKQSELEINDTIDS